jgi:tetratricopeptide (TPR) repeat protein
MMIEQHYDEEVLAEFLAEPGDAVSRDKHLASCDFCLRSLDTLRATTRTLKEPAIWGPTISTTPRPETLAFLRGAAKTMADEDASAAVWIKELLAGPREGWAPRLAQHPEWRTAGMVRRLIAVTEPAINTVPEDAAKIAALAVDIAEKLDASSGLRHLQGLASYYYAYALWYTGAVRESLDVLDRAENRLRMVSGGELDHARVQTLRSMIYESVEKRDEALAAANDAAIVFRRYDDQDRFAAARSSAAVTLQSARRIREALAIHAEVAETARISDRWRLSAMHNMALCYSDLGEFENAARSLVQAISGYERLGMLTFRSRSRWALADLFARQGAYPKALPIYEELRHEFKDLGMTMDLAFVSLDLADTLLACHRGSEIHDVCASAIDYFASAGMAQTEPALRALAYLQEVAAAGQVTPAAIRDVRVFLSNPLDKSERLFLAAE